MFERYTEKARRVIFFARYEASQLLSPLIQPEHLLLDILREDKALTNRFLRQYSEVDSIRKQVEGYSASRHKVRDKVPTSVDLPLSDECKRVFTYTAEEAHLLGNNKIGTEHLLLALLREEKLFVAELLAEHGLRLEAVREQLRHNPHVPDQQMSSAISDRVRAALAEKMSSSLNLSMPLSDQCKRVFTYAIEEAVPLGNTRIDAVHLLLGLLREEKGFAEMLAEFGLSLEALRERLRHNRETSQQPTSAMLDHLHETIAAKRVSPQTSQGVPMSDCLFCKIIAGEIPSKKVYEDEKVFVFEDINPMAPTHVLIVPKRHFAGLKEATASDAEIIGYCHLIAAKLGRERKIEDGYRTVLNVGPRSGQSVFHLHLHLIGGRDMRWPPG